MTKVTQNGGYGAYIIWERRGVKGGCRQDAGGPNDVKGGCRQDAGGPNEEDAGRMPAVQTK